MDPAVKDSARDNRLQFSTKTDKRRDYLQKEKLQKFALEQCSDVVKTYVDCATNSGFLVAFRCQDENTNMNGCLEKWTNKESLEKWIQMAKENGDY